MGFNPFSKKDWDKKVGDPLKKAGGEVKKAAEDVGGEIKGKSQSAGDSIQSTANKAKQEVGKIDDKIRHGVQVVLDDAFHVAFNHAIHAAKDIVSLARRTAWDIEKNHPGIIDSLNSQSIEFGVSIATFEYGDFYARMKEIDRQMSLLVKTEWELNQRAIHGIYNTVRPTKASLGVNVDIAALVATTNALSANIKWSGDTALFGHIATPVMNKMRVPK